MMGKIDRNGKTFFALVLVASTFLGGTGQLFFKLGLHNLGIPSIFIYYLAIGIVAYVVSTVIYFYVLSRRSLSWVYSFGGLSYIFASFFAFFILGEVISPLRWLGIGMIAVGVALIGIS